MALAVMPNGCWHLAFVRGEDGGDAVALAVMPNGCWHFYCASRQPLSHPVALAVMPNGCWHCSKPSNPGAMQSSGAGGDA